MNATNKNTAQDPFERLAKAIARIDDTCIDCPKCQAECAFLEGYGTPKDITGKNASRLKKCPTTGKKRSAAAKEGASNIWMPHWQTPGKPGESRRPQKNP